MCCASISAWVGPDEMLLLLALPIPALLALPVGVGTLLRRCRIKCRWASSWTLAMMVGASVSGSRGWYALGKVSPVSSQLESLVFVGSLATSYMMAMCSLAMWRMMGLRYPGRTKSLIGGSVMSRSGLEMSLLGTISVSVMAVGLTNEHSRAAVWSCAAMTCGGSYAECFEQW